MATDPARPPASDATAAFMDLLVQTSFDVIAVVTRVGAEHDLSLTLVRMLGILRDRTLTMAELADYLGLKRSTVSGLVDRAERRELVARRTSSVDGRSVQLSLSPKGMALTNTASIALSARLSPVVEKLPGNIRDACPSR
ncbi:MAG TPA: MarR family transcriptional regulator [Galbitalea sp.]|jgi:DNA-binding MarR family transcriptional regulator|nr:MarR family transcriptional regulator [Galbitalea sp.]